MNVIVREVCFNNKQKKRREEFFTVAVIKKKSIPIPAGMFWKPASGHQIKLRQAKLPGREGRQKPAVNPHLHTRARALRKSDTSKLLCVRELREASESPAASCSELKIPGRLDAEARPSRLDQRLMHKLEAGNY